MNETMASTTNSNEVEDRSSFELPPLLPKKLKGFLETLKYVKTVMKGNEERMAELSQRQDQVQERVNEAKEKALAEYHAKLKRIDAKADKDLKPILNQRQDLEHKVAKNLMDIQQLEKEIQALRSSPCTSMSKVKKSPQNAEKSPKKDETVVPLSFSQQVYTLCQLLGCQPPPPLDLQRHKQLALQKQTLRTTIDQLKLDLQNQQTALTRKLDAKLDLEIILEDTQVKHGKSCSKIARDICQFLEHYHERGTDVHMERKMMHHCLSQFHSIQHSQLQELQPVQQSLHELDQDISELQQLLQQHQRDLLQLLDEYARVRKEFNDMDRCIPESNSKPCVVLATGTLDIHMDAAKSYAFRPILQA